MQMHMSARQRLNTTSLSALTGSASVNVNNVIERASVDDSEATGYGKCEECSLCLVCGVYCGKTGGVQAIIHLSLDVLQVQEVPLLIRHTMLLQKSRIRLAMARTQHICMATSGAAPSQSMQWTGESMHLGLSNQSGIRCSSLADQS